MFARWQICFFFILRHFFLLSICSFPEIKSLGAPLRTTAPRGGRYADRPLQLRSQINGHTEWNVTLSVPKDSPRQNNSCYIRDSCGPWEISTITEHFEIELDGRGAETDCVPKCERRIGSRQFIGKLAAIFVHLEKERNTWVTDKNVDFNGKLQQCSCSLCICSYSTLAVQRLNQVLPARIDDHLEFVLCSCWLTWE